MKMRLEENDYNNSPKKSHGIKRMWGFLLWRKAAGMWHWPAS